MSCYCSIFYKNSNLIINWDNTKYFKISKINIDTRTNICYFVVKGE